MKKKNYKPEEKETPVLKEPQAAYITQSSNRDQLKAPCEYSMEELKAGIPEFEEEFENDDLTPHEAIRRK